MNFKNIKSISKKLQTIWKSVYIVGWWCRENILWNKSYNWDIDLTTDALPFEIEKVLDVIKEVGKKYWTLIIKEWNEVFEITTFRSDIWILNNRKPVEVVFTNNLKLDSKRRDFTLNSIYYDIKNEVFIDPENGINDIKNHVIRFVWNIKDRVGEDALRILRFIRIKNKYNFKIAEESYFEILRENIVLLKNISIERIKDEFDKILLLENNINALNDLKVIWFFEEIIPEIDNLDKTPWWAKYHLEWDVWIHTLMTINELNNILKNWLKLSNNNIKYFSINEKIDFYRTMLLHDIAKYETYSLDENWFIHYFEHEKLWFEKAKIILKKFKFSTKSTKKILYLIENHLKIFKVFDMKKLKSRKFMMHKYFVDLMVVWTSDHLWRIPADENLVIKLKDFYNDFLEILKTKVFFNWHDIIKMYPEISWKAIKEKLTIKNDEILLKD